MSKSELACREAFERIYRDCAKTSWGFYAEPDVQYAWDNFRAGWNARATTPASRWRDEGKEDPHYDTYDCERASLCGGDMTDDELANEIFMALPPGAAGIGQAAKDRIRWLSRKLVEATEKLQENK